MIKQMLAFLMLFALYLNANQELANNSTFQNISFS